MRKLLLTLGAVVLGASLMCASVGWAQQEKSPSATKQIKCCVKGECKDMTKTQCKNAKGNAVSSCDKCKKAE